MNKIDNKIKEVKLNNLLWELDRKFSQYDSTENERLLKSVLKDIIQMLYDTDMN